MSHLGAQLGLLMEKLLYFEWSHHDIYTFCYWHIFCHIFMMIFSGSCCNHCHWLMHDERIRRHWPAWNEPALTTETNWSELRSLWRRWDWICPNVWTIIPWIWLPWLCSNAGRSNRASATCVVVSVCGWSKLWSPRGQIVWRMIFPFGNYCCHIVKWCICWRRRMMIKAGRTRIWQWTCNSKPVQAVANQYKLLT